MFSIFLLHFKPKCFRSPPPVRATFPFHSHHPNIFKILLKLKGVHVLSFIKVDVWYSLIYPITFVPSLWKETKHIESSCFHSWKETPPKDIPVECTYSIVQDENRFTITSGNSLKMMNLLIQWMTWNYAFRHCLLIWWKTS